MEVELTIGTAGRGARWGGCLVVVGRSDSFL